MAMKQEHENILKHHRPDLVKVIDLKTSGLYSELRKKELLDRRKEEHMKSLPSNDAQVEELLDYLPKRGKKAFNKFCRALEASGQSHVVEEILEAPEAMKPLRREHKECLQSRHLTIVQSLNNIDSILEHIYSENILSHKQSQELKEATEKCQLLLKMLEKRPDCIYSAFVSILRQHGEDHTANILDNKYVDVTLKSVVTAETSTGVVTAPESLLELDTCLNNQIITMMQSDNPCKIEFCQTLLNLKRKSSEAIQQLCSVELTRARIGHSVLISLRIFSKSTLDLIWEACLIEPTVPAPDNMIQDELIQKYKIIRVTITTFMDKLEYTNCIHLFLSYKSFIWKTYREQLEDDFRNGFFDNLSVVHFLRFLQGSVHSEWSERYDLGSEAGHHDRVMHLLLMMEQAQDPRLYYEITTFVERSTEKMTTKGYDDTTELIYKRQPFTPADTELQPSPDVRPKSYSVPGAHMKDTSTPPEKVIIGDEGESEEALTSSDSRSRYHIAETPVEVLCSDWERSKAVLESRVKDIAFHLDFSEFADYIFKNGYIDKRFYHSIKRQKYSKRLSFFVDHIVSTQNSFLLGVLLHQEDIKELNIIQELEEGPKKGEFALSKEQKDILETSLVPSEVDSIAQHLCISGHISQGNRDRIHKESDRKKKTQDLIMLVLELKIFDCLLRALDGLQRDDIITMLTEEGDAQDALHMEPLASTTTDLRIVNYIARTVLRDSYPVLADSLKPDEINELTNQLNRRQILDSEALNQVQQAKESSKMKCLLNILSSTGFHGYTTFKQMLKKSGKHDVVKTLQITEHDFKEMPMESLSSQMACEQTDIEGHIDMFDGDEHLTWDFQREGARDEAISMIEACVHHLGLQVGSVEEGNLFNLTCTNIQDFLRFCNAYFTYDLARRFTSHIKSTSDKKSALVSIDRHTLITAFHVHISKHHPSELQTETQESSSAILGQTDLHKQLAESRSTERTLREELNSHRMREKELLAQSYLMYKAKAEKAAGSDSALSQDTYISEVSKMLSVTTGETGYGSEYSGATDEKAATQEASASQHPEPESQGELSAVIKSKGFIRYLRKLEGAMSAGMMQTLETGVWAGVLGKESMNIQPVPMSEEDIWGKQYVKPTENKKRVVGLAVFEMFMFIAHQEDPNLYLYDLEKHRLGKVTIPQLVKPALWGSLAVIPTVAKMPSPFVPIVPGDIEECITLSLLALNPQTLYLLSVDLSEWTVSLVNTVRLQYEPRSVTFDMRTQTLTVTCSRSVEVFSERGDHVTSLNVARQSVSHPVCSVRLSSGVLVITDWDKEKLVWLDDTGNVVLTYPSEKRHTRLRRPQSLVLHKDDHILVGCMDDTVHQLTPNGDYVFAVIQQSPGSEPHLCIHGQTLYVGHLTQKRPGWTTEVRIFDLHNQDD